MNMKKPRFTRVKDVYWHDPSLLSLLLANVVTIVLALWQGWGLAVLMWIYWGQSLVIGIFNFARMLQLEHFSTDGVRFNDQPVPATEATKRSMAWFFACHYGFFHLVYCIFLMVEQRVTENDVGFILLCVGLFAANHLFSYRHNRERDRNRRRNLGTVMFFPYARIFPMHLTIIFGSLLAKAALALPFFLVLKTVADLVMHAVEHAQESGAEAEVEIEGS